MDPPHDHPTKGVARANSPKIQVSMHRKIAVPGTLQYRLGFTLLSPIESLVHVRQVYKACMAYQQRGGETPIHESVGPI